MTKKNRQSEDETKLNNTMSSLQFCPEPDYRFQIGDLVRAGCLENARITQVMEGGKFYKVSYTVPRTEEPGSNYFAYYRLRPINNETESVIRNKDIKLQFFTSQVNHLISKVLDFGVDMQPEYQRELVWTEHDREALIGSIFNNIDIGKFVFVERPFEPNGPGYEILDGKQRLTAIVDYYLNRFPYQGKYYNDLSVRDQDWFTGRAVAIAECGPNTTTEEKLQYFLMLNTSGHVVSEEHLDKVREMLETVRGKSEETVQNAGGQQIKEGE